ncbi:ABC-2 type transport system ATP-binding protein [Anoxybacillus kamchatkensis]|uniref:ABC transporter ATP-binding protein n=1 Tax=Anoxybacillus ayderensis TaxID=265546 RepID=UPI0015EBC4BC|nr:ABC transporter ATP-binding protein [Anoxybacillus ayderensis]MBA2878214.1 ABC-2 type transport system ATP-binding protein [Anoxybacillus ayderensis]
MLEVKQLTKIYNEQNKVENISFSVQPGQCLALCGGNGAGKSTIIKMLIGQLTPTKGDICVNGKQVKKYEKKWFSFMPDHLQFPPLLTGYEVLSLFGRWQGATAERVEQCLQLVGLTNDQHKQVKTYSKGMQQRLAFAQALLADAPLLILDEPTNGLDPYWVWEFKRLIQIEKERGKAILFSTHMLSIVEEIADAVAFIHQGQMLVYDSVSTLCQDGQSLESIFFAQLSQHMAY